MKLFLPVVLIVSLSSCYRYQYLTLSSDNTRLNEKNEFVAENDTFRITYNFYGKNGPVNVTIYNKLSQALEIDWRRSSLIFGDKPISFYQPDLKVTGDISRLSGLRTANSSINAVVQRQEGVEFIPPRATIFRSGLFVAKSFLNVESTSRPGKKVKAQGDFKKEASAISFSKENSPIILRGYLTFDLPEKGEQIFSIEHTFYVSELVETVATPQYILPDKGKAGNKFFIGRLGG